ncbi:MAG: hypothetical protein EXR69_07830 [Myxococcales bacterium]|nr:hypothetical protein [Myxococcales bacterium]
MTGDAPDPQVESAPAAAVPAPIGAAPPVDPSSSAAVPVEPARPAELALPAEPAELALPAEPTELALPAEPPAPSEPQLSPEPEERRVEAELGGYAELRAAGMFGVTGNPFVFAERVRPRFSVGPADGPLAGRLKAEVVVEAALTQGRDTGKELRDTIFASDIGELLTLANCAYAPEPLYATVADALSVERLHVDFNLKSVDLKVGRQAIRWGSGLAFHPTDLYAEVLVTEPWREPSGINAVKAAVPLGGSDVTAVVAIGDDLSTLYTVAQGRGNTVPLADVPLSAALRGTVRLGGVDVALIGQARSDQRWFAGGDLRGTLGVGYWAEGGWHGEVHTDRLDSDGYVEVLAGVDYSFPLLSMFYIAAEYRYDGSGSAPDEYDYTSRLSGQLPFDCAMLSGVGESATRITLGRHYIDGALRLGLTEEFSVQAAVLANLQDGTGYLIPSLGWTATDRIVINLGGQVPVGEDGEFKPAASSLSYTLGTASVDLSGLLPDATFTGWVRYSF